MSTPPPAGTGPSAADSLDAASSNADASAKPDDVGSPAASCPPSSSPSPNPAPAPAGPQPPGPKTFIEILVTDEKDKPVANQKYRLKLPGGSLQEGKLDANGRIYLSSIPAGTCDLMFLEMLDFGTPDDEIKRKWDWKHKPATAPPARVTEWKFDDSEAEVITPGNSKDTSLDDSADEED